MEQKRLLILLTFFLALGGVILIVVSLATDHWVESTPELKLQTNISNPKSEASFGLFRGTRKLDRGLSPRPSDLTVVCAASKGLCVVYPTTEQQSGSEYIDFALQNSTDVPLWKKGLFNYGYWVTCILSAAICMVFGLVSMGFAVFNVCGKPIETITGPMGLYVWNGIALLFAILDMVMFLILFLSSLKKNFLLFSEYENFNVEDHTHLGYSFYLVPAASALYLVNILLMVGSGYKLRCSFSNEAEKSLDNGVILY